MFEHKTTSKQQLQNQVVWILRSLQNLESEGKMRCPGFMKLQCPNGIIDQVNAKILRNIRAIFSVLKRRNRPAILVLF